MPDQRHVKFRAPSGRSPVDTLWTRTPEPLPHQGVPACPVRRQWPSILRDQAGWSARIIRMMLEEPGGTVGLAGQLAATIGDLMKATPATTGATS